MTPIRERLVALAENFAGVSVSTDRLRYLDVVRDVRIDGAERDAFFAAPKTSGCALTVRGIWRDARLDHPILRAPYRIGRAVADVVEIARASNAWVPAAVLARDGRRPLPGDVVLVGAPAHEHVYTVVDADHELDVYASVDGGQLVDQQQAIARRQRTWTRAGGALLDAVPPGHQRPVVGMVDVDLLPWPAAARAAGCALPGG